MRYRHGLTRWWACLTLLVLLASCASQPPPSPSPAMAEALDPVSSPEWTNDMARFAAEDLATPPPLRPIVFTGSSSIRLWTRLNVDFPGLPVLNRGFGGSQIRDAVWYADEIGIRYRPRRILLYAGDNDIDAGRSPQQVHADFAAFVDRIRRELPGTPVGFIAIKPSPARIDQLPRQREANALVQAYAARTPGVDYLDIATPMVDAGGAPRPELFVDDGLHMNHAGYAIWRRVIADSLR